MEDTTSQERNVLREYFRANAVPTQEQFWQFIQSTLNSAEDGISKTRSTALNIRPSAMPGRQVIELFKRVDDGAPTWTLELQPSQNNVDYPGLNFARADKNTTLFLNEADGRVGMGTINPKAHLHITADESSNWRHDSLIDHITLGIGNTEMNRPGTVKLYGSGIGDFALLRHMEGKFMLDSTDGHFYFNRDSSIRQAGRGGNLPTVLHLMNGEQEEAIRLQAGGDSYLKTGRLGIGTENPMVALHITTTSEASVATAGNGGLIVGQVEGMHLTLDADAVMVKSGPNSPGTLLLQPDGGDTRIGGPVHIAGDLELAQDLLLRDDLSVDHNLTLGGDFFAHNSAAHVRVMRVAEDIHALGAIHVQGASEIGPLTVRGPISVTGDSTVQGASQLNGPVTLNGDNNVVAGRLTTHGKAVFKQQVEMEADAQLNGTLQVGNNLFAGNITARFAMQSLGPATFASLTVSGDTQLGTVVAQGDATVNGKTQLDQVQVTGTQTNDGFMVVNNTLQVNHLAAIDSIGTNGTISGVHLAIQNIVAQGAVSANTLTVTGGLEVLSPSFIYELETKSLNVQAGSATLRRIISDDLTVNGPSNLQSVQADGPLQVNGMSILRDATVSNNLTVQETTRLNYLDVSGVSTLNSVQANGPLQVNGISTLRDATVNNNLTVQENTQLNYLNVGGVSTLNSVQANGSLQVNGMSTLRDATVSNQLTVQEHTQLNRLDVGGHSILRSMNVNQSVQIGEDLSAQNIHARANLSVDGHTNVHSIQIWGLLENSSPSRLNDVNISGPLVATSNTSLNTLQAQGTQLQSLVVLDGTDVGGLHVRGELNVNGYTRVQDLEAMVSLRVNGHSTFNSVDFNGPIHLNGPVHSNGPLNLNGLNVMNSTTLQDATIQNLNVTGVFNFSGLNGNGPVNFQQLNIDGGINFANGMYRIDAAAAEMHIGSTTSPDALTILPTGQLRINMSGTGFSYSQADLAMKGRMDITDGMGRAYDPTSTLDGANFKAELCVTGRRSRIAIASDIYGGMEPGSTLEFAAIDGAPNSAFVFSVEQLRTNNNMFPGPVGPSNLPGTKLGFYLWHREFESDNAANGGFNPQVLDRIPFAIDGAKFRVGIGTSSPRTRLDIMGRPNSQMLQMVLTESENGQLENEYSGVFNNFTSNNSIGGSAIGFSTEFPTGMPLGPGGMMGPGEVVNNLMGKIGLHRNPNNTPQLPGMPGMPENTGMEINSYNSIPIRLRINEETLLNVRKDPQTSQVEIGNQQTSNTRLTVYGDLKVDRPYLDLAFGSFIVPGPPSSYIPIWYKELDADGGLLEVEFFTASPAFPAVFRMNSFYYDPAQQFSSAGIVMVDTLHNGASFAIADATLLPNGFRLVWLRGGMSYRWRSNLPVKMYDQSAPPTTAIPAPRTTVITDLNTPSGRGSFFRQIP
jgi:hypothetical protein